MSWRGWPLRSSISKSLARPSPQVFQDAVRKPGLGIKKVGKHTTSFCSTVGQVGASMGGFGVARFSNSLASWRTGAIFSRATDGSRENGKMWMIYDDICMVICRNNFPIFRSFISTQPFQQLNWTLSMGPAPQVDEALLHGGSLADAVVAFNPQATAIVAGPGTAWFWTLLSSNV